MIETLLLVFDQRIFLAVTDQADALLQVIQRQQVVLPLRVDDVEHDDALVGAHRFRPICSSLSAYLTLSLSQIASTTSCDVKFGKSMPFAVSVEIVDGLDLDLVVFDVPIVGRHVGIQILLGEIGQQVISDASLTADRPSGIRAGPALPSTGGADRRSSRAACS